MSTEPELHQCSRCPATFTVPPKAKSVPGICRACHAELLAIFWATMEEN